MTGECLEFITRIAEKLQIKPKIICTALNIIHIILKKKAFTEIDRHLYCAVSLYIACKIDDFHLSLSHVAQAFYDFKMVSFKNKRNS